MKNEMDFRIFIPSYKRAENKHTHFYFSDLLKKKTTFVIYEEEEKIYRKFVKGVNFFIVPEGIKGITNKRQYLIENIEDEKIIMLDDDLRFATKVKNENIKSGYSLLVSSPEDIEKCFLRVSDELEKYAHVSVLGREGANHYFDIDPFENGRYSRFLAYRRSILMKHNIKFNILPFQEDFHVAVSLLKRGYPSCIITSHTQGQMTGSNAKGGCSVYRTQGKQNSNSARLSLLHKPFVRLKIKRLKKGWGGDFKNKFFDVTISWKKAFERGVKKYGRRKLEKTR